MTHSASISNEVMSIASELVFHVKSVPGKTQEEIALLLANKKSNQDSIWFTSWRLRNPVRD